MSEIPVEYVGFLDGKPYMKIQLKSSVVHFCPSEDEILACIGDGQAAREGLDALIERYFRAALNNLICHAYPKEYDAWMESLKTKFGSNT